MSICWDGLGVFSKDCHSIILKDRFLERPSVDLVSKFIVLFTFRAFVPQADVLLGKPRDFRASQTSLGLPIEPLSLFSDNVFCYMRLICAYHTEPFYIFCECECLIFDFLNNLSKTHIFLASLLLNHSCEFCFICLDLIRSTNSMTPMTFYALLIFSKF